MTYALNKLLTTNQPKNDFLTLHGRGCYYIEASPLICSENQWTGFYMIMVPVMKELKKR